LYIEYIGETVLRTREVNCIPPCPVWSQWSATSECSASCGGIRNETSICRYDGSLSTICEGKK